LYQARLTQITTAPNEVLSIRTPLDAVEEEPWSLDAERTTLAQRIPHLHRPVLASTHDPLAVGTETCTPDIIGVSREREEFLSLLRLPDLNGLVLGGADDPLAIGTVRHVGERTGVSGKNKQRFSRLRVPDAHRLV